MHHRLRALDKDNAPQPVATDLAPCASQVIVFLMYEGQ